MEDEKNLNDIENKEAEEKGATPEVQEEPKVEEPTTEAPVENKEEKQEEAPAIPDAPKDEAPTIIDNSAEPPITPIQDLPRTVKLKEPMSKHQKMQYLSSLIGILTQLLRDLQDYCRKVGHQ